MPTSADVPIAHADASGLAAPVAGVVADDLQAIFPDARSRPHSGRSPLGVGREERRSRRRQSRVAALGAMAAAALAGLSMGALIGRHPTSAAPTTSAGERVPIVLASQRQAPAREIKVSPTRPAQPAAAEGLPGPGPLAPPQLVWVTSEARPTAVKVRSESSARPRAQRTARRTPPSSQSFESKYAPAPIPASASRCRNDCDYEDVLTADGRLRRAYASAADAGVSRSVLVNYRNEWSGLRKRAPGSPDRVVSRYHEMAQDLERYADSPKAGREPSRRSHTLAGLRADLASIFP